MKRSEKAERIAQQLEELYPVIPIPLDHSNPFELLVAVLMSAQTTARKVNEVTPALFAKADNPKSMANLSIDVILNDIRQVGLAPTKAKTFIVFLKCSTNCTKALSPIRSRNSRHFQELGIKQQVS